MSDPSKKALPSNPFSRQPVRKTDQLAGRGKEIRTIQYYLGLTASGQNPHLALIGQRGVGKTSLLNGIEEIAAGLKLLPVRIDLNEQKVRSPGEFWYDLYATLILSLAKVGCWGGLHAPIYGDLFAMMHARQKPESLDRVVLQIPFAFACHKGEHSTFLCADALVKHDFQSCIEELSLRGYVGIVLLVDEADCLGTNVALLQMLRNIFQVVPRMSLILAGTEAIFPSISEIFSPIPRQFHRIDVKPFAHANDTIQLVMKPLKAQNIEDIAASHAHLRELHELCGGDPSEVQLYCHHMYRMVEQGKAKQMALAPQVFREVLREYRASAPANIETVINAIERLPDKYLCESQWLSRRNISVDENIRIEILRSVLERGTDLSSEERAGIGWDLKQGYQALFDTGIIESDNRISLVGAPLTAGYWKSFVEVEKGKRWSWNDSNFGEILKSTIAIEIAKNLNVRVPPYELKQGDDVLLALHALRNDEPIPEFSDSFSELIITGILAHEEESLGAAVDVGFQMESPAGRQAFRYRFIEASDNPISENSIKSTIESKSELLASNDIVLSASSFTKWVLPTSVEFHRLARIAEVELPKAVFGPTEIEIAIAKFGEGNVEECAYILERMCNDKSDVILENNLGFCRLTLGQHEEGFKIIDKALRTKYDPLYELNKGIALYLLGKAEEAVDSLRHSLEWIKQNSDNKYSKDHPIYVLFLNPTAHTVKSVPDVPLIAALHINLWFMGKETKEELERNLEEAFPDSYRSILLLVEG